MKLEQQVCSLELAKRLKELGVKQESLFRWVPWLREEFSKRHKPRAVETDNFYVGEFAPDDFKTSFSAFTVAELGEMLPFDLHLEDEDRMLELYQFRMDEKWGIAYHNQMVIPDDYRWEFEANTEADARAKMFVYLLENKLIVL